MHRITTIASTAGLLATLGAVSGSTTARACSCSPTPVVVPEADTADVPTNTRIWVRGYMAFFADTDWAQGCGTPLPTLESTEGTVALSVGVVQPYLMVLTPQTPLTEGVEYTLVAPCPDLESAIGAVQTTFTVSAPADDEAPTTPAPTVLDIIHDVGEVTNCGDAHYARVDLATDADISVVDVGAMGSLDTATMSGSLSDAVVGVEALVGDASCQNNWEEADFGASATVRYGAFDLAGNFSGWGEHLLELGGEAPGGTAGDGTAGTGASADDTGADPGATDGDGGCGCASAPATESRGWLGLAMVLLLGLRRRRWG